MTPDCINVDHRQGISFAPGDLTAYIRSTWDVALDNSIYMYAEAVHRLSDLGAIVTHTLKGTSHEGFDAEWKGIALCTFDGDKINHREVFDEADLHAAIARFDELATPARRLENAATQAYARAQAYNTTRDWIALAEVLSEDLRVDDRRPMVGAGVRHGRDEAIADMRATADLGITKVTSTVVATRAERLMLVRGRHTRPDQGSGAFHTEVLGVYETNAEGRISAVDVFAHDELDAALQELDRRYLAGEAAAHEHTWSVIVEAFAALNRHELFATTPDWINIDHRSLATFEAGDLAEYLRATWDLTPQTTIYIAAVHRLSNLGVVLTHAGYGTSQQGFDAEWRMVELVTVEGDLISRGEIFAEEDLDTALARFDELASQARRLENAASRT